jgi:hypothetical protein
MDYPKLYDISLSQHFKIYNLLTLNNNQSWHYSCSKDLVDDLSLVDDDKFPLFAYYYCASMSSIDVINAILFCCGNHKECAIYKNTRKSNE